MSGIAFRHHFPGGSRLSDHGSSRTPQANVGKKLSSVDIHDDYFSIWSRSKLTNLDQKIIISPGPGNPNQAGNCLKIVKNFYSEIPILGVCLGHQIIGQVFGSKIIHAKKLMHGKLSIIKHNNKGILKGLNKTFEATRYHSLVVDKKNLGKNLIITAETKNKVIMGIMHKKHNVHGVQFHPESIKTPIGLKLLKNFIDYN